MEVGKYILTADGVLTVVMVMSGGLGLLAVGGRIIYTRISTILDHHNMRAALTAQQDTDNRPEAAQRLDAPE